MERSADPNTDDRSQTTTDMKGPAIRLLASDSPHRPPRPTRHHERPGCSCSSKRTRMGRPPQLTGLSHRDTNSYSR
jgi:hypothetical protein